jgi:hypothetical protein
MPAISWLDVMGYFASLTVLATFCMDTFVSLRIVAIVSNVLFGIYGIGAHIYPVFLLHAVLLPINILKLVRLQPANRERCTVLENVRSIVNRIPLSLSQIKSGHSVPSGPGLPPDPGRSPSSRNWRLSD